MQSNFKKFGDGDIPLEELMKAQNKIESGKKQANFDDFSSFEVVQKKSKSKKSKKSEKSDFSNFDDFGAETNTFEA